MGSQAINNLLLLDQGDVFTGVSDCENSLSYIHLRYVCFSAYVHTHKNISKKVKNKENSRKSMKYEFPHNVIILNIITRVCEPSVWEKQSLNWVFNELDSKQLSQNQDPSVSKKASNLFLKSQISVFLYLQRYRYSLSQVISYLASHLILSPTQSPNSLFYLFSTN